MSEEPEETALYRVYGEADLLLYIGISKDFGRRWKEEAVTFPWWYEKRRMTILWHDSREDAEAAEEAAIRAERPKYNKRYNDGLAERPVKVARQPVACAERQKLPARSYAMRNCMYMDELRTLPALVDLETAGRAHSLARSVSYELAQAGEFPCPVHRRGRYYRVRKADLVTSLGLGMDGRPLAADPPQDHAGAA